MTRGVDHLERMNEHFCQHAVLGCHGEGTVELYAIDGE